MIVVQINFLIKQFLSMMKNKQYFNPNKMFKV